MDERIVDSWFADIKNHLDYLKKLNDDWLAHSKEMIAEVATHKRQNARLRTELEQAKEELEAERLMSRERLSKELQSLFDLIEESDSNEFDWIMSDFIRPVADVMFAWLKMHGAENHMAMSLKDRDGNLFDLTLRKADGKTVVEKMNEMKARIAELRDGVREIWSHPEYSVVDVIEVCARLLKGAEDVKSQ